MKNIVQQNSKIVWEDLMAKKYSIIQLFKSIGLDNYVLVNVRTRYTIDGNRFGVIVTVRKKDSGNFAKVIIDAKNGTPTWAQLMDTTFKLGVDCESRIILYGDIPGVGQGPYDCSHDEFVAESFMTLNNFYEVSTYIAKVSYFENDLNKKLYKFDLVERKDFKPVSKCKEDHSREFFEKAEFWILYSEMKDDEHMALNPEYWCGDYEDIDLPDEYKYTEDVNFNTDWNQEGYFLYVTTHTATGVDKLKYLYENHYTEFHEMMKGLEIDHKKESDIKHKITIKILDGPFINYVCATTEEKRAYIEDIYKVEHGIMGCYGNIIEDDCADMWR